MENIFIKHKRCPNNLDKEDNEILNALSEIREKLLYAELCLDYMCDELLIDSIIYEIMSLQKKYDYYLILSKEKGIVISSPNILRKFTAS